MRRLTQSKETLKQKTSSVRRKQPVAETMRRAATESAAVIEEAGSVASEVATEEPLPFVMAEMALWGTAMSALMIPIGIATLLASPFAIARDMFRSRTPATATANAF